MQLDTHILGQTNEPLDLDSNEALHQVSVRMVEQCGRQLDIYSRCLEPRVYDSVELVAVVRKLALRSRHSRIRVVLIDPETVSRRGHRLLDLTQKLSTFIEFRKVGAEHKDFNEAFLLADSSGVIHQRLSDRFDATANFNHRPDAQRLQRQFDEVWEKATPDPNLRRLSL